MTREMAVRLQLLLVCLAATSFLTTAKEYDWEWKEGRATFYGKISS
jgi:hypothetical protein